MVLGIAGIVIGNLQSFGLHPFSKSRHAATVVASLPIVPRRTGIRDAGSVGSIGLVGDSIMLGASRYLVRDLPVVATDAVVGRRAYEVRAVIARLSAERALQPVTVLDLGTNDEVDVRTLRAILDLLKPCGRVVVVNARAPRPWVRDNDSLLGQVVPRYANATLADWYRASDRHPEYFLPDGVHPNALGLQAYTRTIVVALETSRASHRFVQGASLQAANTNAKSTMTAASSQRVR